MDVRDAQNRLVCKLHDDAAAGSLSLTVPPDVSCGVLRDWIKANLFRGAEPVDRVAADAVRVLQAAAMSFCGCYVLNYTDRVEPWFERLASFARR